MVKRILAITMLLSVALSLAVRAVDNVEIQDTGYGLIDTDDQAEITSLIDECLDRQETAHTIAECVRTLGCQEDHPIIKWASKEWWIAQYCIEEYKKWIPAADVAENSAVMETDEIVHVFTNDAQWEEYPVAAEVYEFLRGEMSLSPAVASGILGSMMQECGGCTLNLQWDLTAGSGKYAYRGLHMWNLYYCPEMATANLQEQLQYLKDTLDSNINYFGGRSEYLRSLTDPGAVAAYEFTWYGRGGNYVPPTRLTCAYTAYEYFGGV